MFCAVVLTLTGASCSTSSSALKAERVGTIQWTPCGKIECGSLAVPLDPAHPDGPQITLALARRPASGTRRGAADQSRRSGWIRPRLPALGEQRFPHRDPECIRHRVVGSAWRRPERARAVPRPSRCVLRGESRPSQRGGWPRTLRAARARRRVQTAQRLGAAVRLDREQRATWTRFAPRSGSRRSRIWAFRTGHFSARVRGHVSARLRAMVLDGAVDPSILDRHRADRPIAGFEEQLDEFFAWCKQHSECGFARGADPRAAFDSLARRSHAGNHSGRPRRRAPHARPR